MENTEEISIPTEDKEFTNETVEPETTKILCWDIPTENVNSAKNVIGGGIVLTACCAGFCLLGINPFDTIKVIFSK